jgi:hypothetical protein
MKEGTFIFNVVINIDRLFNILTLGELGVCFSTRAHIKALTAKPMRIRNRWVKIESAIDKLFWKGHCRDSFKWEYNLKQVWLQKHKDLI